MNTCPRCGYLLDVSPSKGKTSPENRLFHALCAKLALWKKVSPDLMKRYCKLYAASVHNYPCENIELDGHRVIEPQSVASASSADMIVLIDTCYELGMEWGCALEQPDYMEGH